MNKKNKFENQFNRQEPEDVTLIIPEEEILKMDKDIKELVEIVKTKSPIFINAHFSEEIVEIGYSFLATSEQNVVASSNGRIHMMQGRMYYVPIGKNDIDSDNYNIKVHSDAADRFDIRYIRDGLAAVVPIRHNAVLKNGERLCVLTLLIC